VLYLDSSALIKHYQNELGTNALNERLKLEAKGSRQVFTSILTYAEIHAIVARRAREKLLSPREAGTVHDAFDADWTTALTTMELDSDVLIFTRDIVKTHPLKGADAVQLASALCLRDMARAGGSNLTQYNKQIVFACSDRQLNSAARKYNLEIFNPEIV
jgi:uncharacterized protein